MPTATNPATGETVFLGDDGQWQPAKTAVNPQTKEMLAFDGKSWTPVPAKSKGVMGYIDDAVRSIASGMTFGFADEIAAKGNELIGRGNYDQNLADEKRRDEQIHPAIRIPGEIGGAVASTLATAPVTAPLAAASGLARLPGLVRSAGIGGAGAAAFGAGNAEPGKRAEGAIEAVPLGVATGVAAPYIAAGASRVAGAVRNAVSPEANVAADLGRALTRDQITPEAFAQRASELAAVRPGVATAADAGGENVRGLVERIAQTPGAGRTQVVPALTTRQQGQMARVAVDLRGLTGTHQSATQAIEETMAQRAQAAGPAYDEAMNFNARAVPEIAREWQAVTSTGWGQHVLRSPDFRRTLQTEYGIADPNNAPLMTVIDAWKKQADGLIGEAIRSGNNNKARVIGDMRERLLGVVDEHNPAYAAARAAWSGPSRYLDAVTEGRNLLNTRVSAEELTPALARMGDAEREAFRIGGVSAIIGKMGSDAAALGDMTKYLRSPEMRAKIAAIMPTPEARAAWQQRLDFEVSSSQLTGRALGNSATARRLAERHDADNIVGDLVMDAFSGHPPVSLLRRAVTAVPQRVRDTLRSRSDHILAELLTDPQGMAQLRQAMDRVTERGAAPSQLRNAATINAATALGTPVQPVLGHIPGMQAGGIGRADQNNPNVPRPPSQ